MAAMRVGINSRNFKSFQTSRFENAPTVGNLCGVFYNRQALSSKALDGILLITSAHPVTELRRLKTTRKLRKPAMTKLRHQLKRRRANQKAATRVPQHQRNLHNEAMKHRVYNRSLSQTSLHQRRRQAGCVCRWGCRVCGIPISR